MHSELVSFMNLYSIDIDQALSYPITTKTHVAEPEGLYDICPTWVSFTYK